MSYFAIQVKRTRTVCVTNDRGGVFVLYNCSRISTLLNQFQHKLNTGYYPPPPCHLDFTTLTKQEEWELVFVYLLCYPGVVQSCVAGGRLSPNLMCKFIKELTNCFSVYYRRIRILTESRSHLLPVMFARLHLLRAVQTVLHSALSYLGISPVTSM
ncbi:hypothetical protein L9F63_025551 [Diploptera punctata]|uniref:DALR anticodon binding domain-containing protein n=1 Tax=Diploptera punctata TaxID=6984 RepID=A0AAD8E4I8_DIPPU|nr:hypothetical protein L9F63_025551 [Diploptera punctata]